MRFGNSRDGLLCNARYTWTNGQEQLVMSRLDKFLVSGTWEDFYPHYFQEAFPRPTMELVTMNRSMRFTFIVLSP